MAINQEQRSIKKFDLYNPRDYYFIEVSDQFLQLHQETSSNFQASQGPPRVPHLQHGLLREQRYHRCE